MDLVRQRNLSDGSAQERFGLPAAKHRKTDDSSNRAHSQKFVDRWRRERMMKATNLDVSPHVLDVLRKMRIESMRDILLNTPIDFRNASLTKKETENLLLKTAMVWLGSNVQNFRVSRSSHLTCARRLSLGCPILNGLLRGGVRSDQLTEVFGAAGAGKTQVCLVLALQAQLPFAHGGLNGETLYISTELFPSRRLKEIANTMASNFDAESRPTMDKIYIENLITLSEVESFLSGRVHGLLSQRPIKLMVVDSITHVFRYNKEASVLERAGRIQRIAVTLRNLQSQYGLTLVCSNQATANITEDRLGVGGISNNNESTVLPALGIAWSNFVTTRIMVEKSYQRDSHRETAVVKRTMRVIFSPYLPQAEVEFEVLSSGLRGIAEMA